MRLTDDFFDDAITPFGIRIGEPVKQHIFLGVFNQVVKIAPFLVAKRLAIGDEKLQIARVRRVHMRIINLVDDAMAQGEPEPGTGVVSGADAVLGAGSPARRHAGSAGGVIIWSWHKLFLFGW